jgi:hypothetical protein
VRKQRKEKKKNKVVVDAARRKSKYIEDTLMPRGRYLISGEEKKETMRRGGGYSVQTGKARRKAW